ncbi:MAG: HEAT repeat domain-containing protein [Desulfobacula sp.]|uniref:DVU0298 family protein n=1 Tax=Desulfobacula sp. TaxID=2593537 RepID=UPI0025C595D3|nr:DVU0298 family protein [Desulfobacula sp.]MCD4721043.1 HEAT repeat domain-containing protein [Desulfobacula sp.]
MTKPYGRETKKRVGKILLEPHRKMAMEMLRQIPDKQLVGHLFSHFYHKDELVKFRSITAMGALGSRMGQRNMEKARIVLRRIMWNLNDESGGIGWGSPEAMGEILCRSPQLALEFKSILFSYIQPGGNYIEHEALQRGVLWGIGTYLESNPRDLNDETKGFLFEFLHSLDPVKRGYAVRALMNAGCLDCSIVPENIMTDHHHIDIFSNWNFTATRVCDMILPCEGHKIFA